MPTIRRMAAIGAILAVASGAVVVFAFVSYFPSQIPGQTSTISAYQIQISPLNHTITATAGSTFDLLFNITSPRTGALYFYASTIPAPGSPWEMRLQNVTAGNIALPQGVQVSYPTGQAVFGTNHAILTLRITLSSNVTGNVGLVVGVFQEASPDQVVGTGSAVYVTVLGGRT